jgi:hypothetical protein
MLGQSLLNCDQLPDTRRGIEQMVELDAKGVNTFKTRARTPDAEVCMSEPNKHSERYPKGTSTISLLILRLKR